MSNPVTALKGQEFKGFVNVKDAGLTGMITLRGDLSDAAIAKAVKSLTGAKMPGLRMIENSAKGSAGWMSPDELLLIVPYEGVAAALAKLDKSLNGVHHLAVDVSDARTVIDLSGKAIRNLLAKGSPADLDKDALTIGMLRRTRLGQLPVAFWFTAEDQARLVCFRSVGQYVFDWLVNGAAKGTDPEYFK